MTIMMDDDRLIEYSGELLVERNGWMVLCQTVKEPFYSNNESTHIFKHPHKSEVLG